MCASLGPICTEHYDIEGRTCLLIGSVKSCTRTSAPANRSGLEIAIIERTHARTSDLDICVGAASRHEKSGRPREQ